MGKTRRFRSFAALTEPLKSTPSGHSPFPLFFRVYGLVPTCLSPSSRRTSRKSTVLEQESLLR